MPSLSTKMGPGSGINNRSTNHAHGGGNNKQGLRSTVGKNHNNNIRNRTSLFRLNLTSYETTETVEAVEANQSDINEHDLDRNSEKFCNHIIVNPDPDPWKPCIPPTIKDCKNSSNNNGCSLPKSTEAAHTTDININIHNVDSEILNMENHIHIGDHNHDITDYHFIMKNDFDNHILINQTDNTLTEKFEEFKKKKLYDIEEKKTIIITNIDNEISKADNLTKQNIFTDHNIINDVLDNSQKFVEDFLNISKEIGSLSEKTDEFNELLDKLKNSEIYNDTESIKKELEDQFTLKENELTSTISNYKDKVLENETIIANLETKLTTLTKKILELETDSTNNIANKSELLEKISKLEDSIKEYKRLDIDNEILINNFKKQLQDTEAYNLKNTADLINHYKDEISELKEKNKKQLLNEQDIYNEQLTKLEQQHKKQKEDIISEYENKLVSSKNELDMSKNSMIEDYNKKMNELEINNKRLEDYINIIENEKDDLEVDIEGMMSKNSDLDQTIKQLENQIKVKEKEFELETNKLVDDYRRQVREKDELYKKEKEAMINTYEGRLKDKEDSNKKEIEDIIKKYESNTTPQTASFLSFRIYNENLLDTVVVNTLKEHINFVKTFLGDIITSSPRKYDILLLIRKLNNNELGAADWLNNMILLNETYLNPNNLPNGWNNLLLNNEPCDIIRQTLLHEVLHVLGIGIGEKWDKLITNAPDNSRRVYIGQHGLREYNNFFSHFNTNYKFIPIEDDFGQGTKDSHLEEGDIYGGNSEKIVAGEIYPYISNEIMTGFLNFSNLFTSICAGILQDQNYTINYSSKNIINSTTSEAYLMSLDKNNLINARLL